ncbi:MAG: [protein-PII] uridylyltransferase [Candidatus Nanopelagicales bacterium]
MDATAYRDARRGLLAQEALGAVQDGTAVPVGLSRSDRRRALVDLTDAWLSQVFAASGAADAGCALVAVGGYGRGDLAPGSDLDLLLLTPDTSAVEDVAERLWYPVWDSGVRVDHSVRTVAQARRMAAQDMRVMLGLLDLRVVAGDPGHGERLSAAVLGDWRALARRRLPDLRATVLERRDRRGDLADLLEPDLKESYGGLRDVTILRAVAASWLTDVPHAGVDIARERLLDMRDALHEEALVEERRPADVLRLQDQDAVAVRMGMVDADELLRAVSQAAREVSYASELTWHRVERLSRPRTVLGRRVRRSATARVPLADGVVAHDGEVVLSVDVRPERDPVLVLRVAAAAAQAGLPIAPATLHRLASESAPMPVPWPPGARDAFVSLLGAGPALVPTWESLDRAGLIAPLIPEWDPVRSAPQRNPVHVFRVDRHLVETAAQASQRVRRVDRPDLLLVGALLHDIGKGRPGDHTEVGMALVERLAPRLGFDEGDSCTLVTLVQHHLLLPEMATRRDLDDPATVQQVAVAVADRRTLDLLHALTEADAAATGPAAWSEWKAGLIETLVAKVRATLAGEVVVEPAVAETDTGLLQAPGLQVSMESSPAATTVIVVADDRPGLLGDIAGVLALNRLEVRSADTRTVGARAISAWTVLPLFGEPPAVEQVRIDLERALSGSLDVAARLAARDRRRVPAAAPARVEFISGAASSADVLEVRAHDEPALLYRLGRVLATTGASITAARVATIGSEAIDCFYVQCPDGSRLDSDDRARIVAAVLAELRPGSAD